MIPSLTIDNCISWYAFANTFGLSAVKGKAREIMLADFASVANVLEFFAMDYEYFADYISWDDVDVNSALIAAARWITHDITYRKELFPVIVQTIDINRCSQSALKYVIDTYGTQLIADFNMFQKFTTAALNNVADWQEPRPGAGFDVIVLGGFSGDIANTKTWMINLNTGDIVDKKEFPSELCKVFVPAMCDTPKGALLVGGAAKCESLSCSEPQTQCALYLKHDDIWALLPEVPEAMMGAGAVCIGDAKMYVIGGLESHRDKMHCLDLVTKTWNRCPDLLQGLSRPVVGCGEKYIYVIFSTLDRNRTLHGNDITLQCFDTITSSWSWKSSLPKSVTHTVGASTVTVAHQLFVIGGCGDICLSYDSTNDTWTCLTPPSHRHSCGAAIFLKNRIILCGGRCSGTKESDVIESYDCCNRHMGGFTSQTSKAPVDTLHNSM